VSFRLIALLICGSGAACAATTDWLDDLDRQLTVSTADGGVRARVSGTLDLEGYRFTQPAPGLIDAGGADLFNPRLTTFLDAQVGDAIYAFAQVRVDRGFDPSDEPMGARIDEIAVRYTPWHDGRFNLQAGKFATAVGNWVGRHGSWDNPFITAPLPYENLTGLWDIVAARSSSMILFWSHVSPPMHPGQRADDKYLRVPIIWGPSYTSGASVFGEIGTMTYAAEVKNASVSSRPGVWNDVDQLFRQPAVDGRVGWKPNEMWNLGVSVSTGTYLQAAAASTLPPGSSRSDYRETVVAQDVSFAWHHFQAWAEVFETRFAVPTVGNADTVAYYVELKYKFQPQFFAAVRWNQQTFSTFRDASGAELLWTPDAWRIDFAPTYRFTAQTELKFQYSLEHQSIGARRDGNLFAVQWVLRY
jgi:hypothetical protein